MELAVFCAPILARSAKIGAPQSKCTALPKATIADYVATGYLVDHSRRTLKPCMQRN
jgi:hypothetical protein